MSMRVEIDLEAIAHNTRLIKAHIGECCALMAVIKADAYGHGMLPVAKICLDSGASSLGVAQVQEGIVLREGGITCPILVMGGLGKGEAASVATADLTQTVWDEHTCRTLDAEAAVQGKGIYVHVKLDSGMNRVGLKTKEEVRDLARVLKECKHLNVEAAFSHFAVSDENSEASRAYTQYQREVFLLLATVLREEGFPIGLHQASSAGALGDAVNHHQIVRPGLALYGVAPPNGADHVLKPAMRWATTISHIKTLHKGEKVGYGLTFEAAREMKLATLSVGYGDGYRRLFSNTAQVLVGGQRACVVGRVCMDQTMVDITGINAQVGDEVILLGAQGQDEITAQELAHWAQTIPYEILLAPTPRAHKVYG